MLSFKCLNLLVVLFFHETGCLQWEVEEGFMAEVEKGFNFLTVYPNEILDYLHILVGA